MRESDVSIRCEGKRYPESDVSERFIKSDVSKLCVRDPLVDQTVDRDGIRARFERTVCRETVWENVCRGTDWENTLERDDLSRDDVNTLSRDRGRTFIETPCGRTVWRRTMWTMCKRKVVNDVEGTCWRTLSEKDSSRDGKNVCQETIWTMCKRKVVEGPMSERLNGL